MTRGVTISTQTDSRRTRYDIRRNPRSVRARISKIERSLNNREKKKFDISHNTGNVDLNGLTFSLNAMPQGVELNERDGLKVQPTGLFFNYKMQCHSSQPTVARILIYEDLQQVSDSTPSSTDLLQQTGDQSVLSPLNRDEIGRFKVLYDKRHTLVPDANNEVVYRKGFLKKLKNPHFNGANGTDIQKNGLWCTILSDQATNFPTHDFYSRYFYHDD